jgi:hypothetical protein
MKSYVSMDRINRIYHLVLYQIRHFAAVAETGSFRKAATSLRTETSGMTILCFALRNDRVRTRDDILLLPGNPRQFLYDGSGAPSLAKSLRPQS